MGINLVGRQLDVGPFLIKEINVHYIGRGLYQKEPDKRVACRLTSESDLGKGGNESGTVKQPFRVLIFSGAFGIIKRYCKKQVLRPPLAFFPQVGILTANLTFIFISLFNMQMTILLSQLLYYLT